MLVVFYFAKLKAAYHCLCFLNNHIYSLAVDKRVTALLTLTCTVLICCQLILKNISMVLNNWTFSFLVHLHSITWTSLHR